MNRAATRPVTILAGILMMATAAAEPFAVAIQEAGIQRGVAVHLGFEDAKHIVALAGEGIQLVHCISSNKELVAKSKQLVQQENLGSRVSVVRQDSLAQLPYSENLVNLLAVENTPKLLSQGLRIQEIFRVLVPRGVACLHGSIDPAKLSSAGFTQIRKVNGWTYGIKPRPREMDDWSHMNHDASGNRVSSDLLVGPPTRLRWIQGPRWPTSDGMDNSPDAIVSANGRIFYDGIAANTTGETAIVARDAYNGTLLWTRSPDAKGHPASFLARGDKLYCGLERGLAALSAATGQTIFQLDMKADSVLYHEGMLFVSSGGLKCLDAESGKLRWQYDVPVAPSRINRSGQLFPNMVIGDAKVFYLSAQDNPRRVAKPAPYILGCVDINSGLPVWRKVIKQEEVGWNLLLCAYRDGVLAVGEAFLRRGMPSRAVHGFSAKDGTELWRHEFDPPKHGGSRADGFFLDGLYWFQLRDSALADRLQWKTQATGWRALDPATGKVVTSFNYPSSQTVLHRCYMDKATPRFFIAGTADFVEPKTQKHKPIRVTRGSCQQGMLPANALVYAYPHGCQCSAYLRGYMALAAEAPDKAGQSNMPPELLLEKGAAFGSTITSDDTQARAEDWPSYRHDNTRGLAASTVVSTELKLAWQVQLDDGLTAPVVADGLVFVVRSSSHEIIALDAESGREAWRFVADGPIDTPPTIHKGLALFGCRDGSLYSLRATDGALAWRLRVASRPHLVVANDHLESAFAIHGSIAIENDVACFVAGRHSSLDGGITIYGVKPTTGEILYRRSLHTPNQEGFLADLLVGDDGNLHMGLLGLHPDSGEIVEPTGSFDPVRFNHLVAGRGSEPVLERTWSVRSIRQKGKATGYVLAFDENNTFGLTLNRHYGKSAYTYVAGLIFPHEGVKLYCASGGTGQGWSKDLQYFANSLLLSGASLFVGGTSNSPDAKGGVLRAYAARNASLLGQWNLDSVPVNDGMAAARGRLYLVTSGGRIYCFRSY